MRAYFILLTFLLTGCSSLLYYPTYVKHVDEAKLPIKPQELEWAMPGYKNSKITAWYFDADPKKEPKAVVLLFHGNGQNLSSQFYSLYWILQHNYDYIVFDYPGYGRSHGEPSPQNTVDSGVSAVAKLKELMPKTPWVILGQSLGGAIALRTAHEAASIDKPCLVVVESTFHSYKKVVSSVLRQNWFTWPFQPLAYLLFSDNYAPKNQIAKISPTPLIVIHGDKDVVVDISLGQKVFDLANEPKEFWLVEGGAHTVAFTGRDKLLYQNKLLASLDKHCLPQSR